jgi:hypothetical protein
MGLISQAVIARRARRCPSDCVAPAANVPLGLLRDDSGGEPDRKPVTCGNMKGASFLGRNATRWIPTRHPRRAPGPGRPDPFRAVRPTGHQIRAGFVPTGDLPAPRHARVPLSGWWKLPDISVSRFVSSLWSGASPVVCPCIAVIGLGPTACNRVGQTTGGAAHDVRRGNRGSSMPRGARPGRQLASRRSGGCFDHLASTAGGDRRIPFLTCGHDRVKLTQQRGSDGSVGLPTVEFVLGAAG